MGAGVDPIRWHSQTVFRHYGGVLAKNLPITGGFAALLYAITGGAALAPFLWVALVLVTEGLAVVRLSLAFWPRRIGIETAGLVVPRGRTLTHVPWSKARIIVNAPRVLQLLTGWCLAWDEPPSGHGIVYVDRTAAELLLGEPRLERREWASRGAPLPQRS